MTEILHVIVLNERLGPSLFEDFDTDLDEITLKCMGWRKNYNGCKALLSHTEQGQSHFSEIN